MTENWTCPDGFECKQCCIFDVAIFDCAVFDETETCDTSDDWSGCEEEH